MLLTDKQRKIISAALEIGSWLTYIGIALIFAKVIFKWDVLALAITLLFVGVVIMGVKKNIVREDKNGRL